MPEFGLAKELGAGLDQMAQLGFEHAEVDLGGLTRPAVVETLALLDQHNGEIWAKLDAGTEGYFQQVSRTRFSLQQVLDSILTTARIRPIVLQSLFMRIHGAPPPAEEVAAYVGQLRSLLAHGARISPVQIYTVARRTAEPYVTPLSEADLAPIATAVRALGLPVAIFP